MSSKLAAKKYWEMTTAELREATKEFDEEFVADKCRPLTPAERALWEEIRAEDDVRPSNGATKISIQVDKALLDRCTALAKKKRLSRDRLIERGLRAVLAVEGEA